MATTIRIGHASWSENKSAYGTAGDQTGYEVCENSDFTITSLNPNILLRPTNQALAEASARACEAGCANPHIGYSQSGRNTLNNLAKEVGYDLSKSKITTDCNTDCSAFMTVCAIAGGSRIDYGSNAPTTTNMRTRFKQSGDYVVLTDSKHLTQTDYLKRGDILVHEGDHTVMVLDNGSSYADEDSIGSESGSTGITSITDIRIRCIDISINSIEATDITVKINIIERKAGVADKTLSSNILKNYDWSYLIVDLKESNTKTKQTTINSSGQEISIEGLKSETTYALQVVATNKKTSNKEFCSQKILFTTLPIKVNNDNNKKEFTCKTAKAVDHIYVKTDNKFKQAIIYEV